MLFNSLEFALFLPIVVGLYFLLPGAWRTPLLLLASCVFYAAFIPAYILILLLTILIDYTAGIYLERVEGGHRRALLIVSIVATCLVLFVFKYFYFFTESFIDVAGLFGWHLSEPALKIILPIGLSFHTFQSLSYVIEVYKGRQAAEKDFIAYATYVMFFPQLVAGPIERPQNLLHQFHETHRFDYDRVTSGLKRIAWGFFKKLVVADRLALYVNDVYGAPRSHNGLQLTLGTFFFAYQIYCDFSGYSDIAIGSARIMGFKLMENFDTPYRSRSIAEFWHRWHISLSTWFRDYVYIPLGGSRVARSRWYLNLLIVFGLSGLWHGANWTYVVWGLLNGVYLIGGVVFKPVRERVYRSLGIRKDGTVISMVEMAGTFVLVCSGWVIFRAKNLPDAAYVFTHFWRDWDLQGIRTENFLLRQLPVAVLALIALELVQWGQRRGSLSGWVSEHRTAWRWSFYTASVVMVVLFGVYRKSQFIYFQF